MQFGSIGMNANVYVFAILGGFLAFAIVFGEARLKKIAIALLVGFFAADQLADFVGTHLSRVGVKSVDDAMMHVILLTVVAVPLSLGKASGQGGRFSLRSIILAFLVGSTLIAYTHSYLAVAMQEQLSTEYNLIAIAADNRLWWLSGLILWLIILQLWKKKEPDEDGKGKKGKKK
ncbi:MAG: hypothetical protein WCI47_02430 [bacterium]